MTERTLVLIKPDAVTRGLVGEVLSRFERKGLAMSALVLRTMDVELADRHYAEHVEKAFYPPLRDFMTSGPLVAGILSGDEAIEVVRVPGRRHRRAQGRRRHDPGRPVAVQPGEPGARLRLARQRRARDRALVPRADCPPSAPRGRETRSWAATAVSGTLASNGIDPAITGEPPEERASHRRSQ